MRERPGAGPPATVDQLLAVLRAGRAVDTAELAAAKVGVIAGWFAEQGLDAAVVGVSGGVDSSLVLALLRRVADEPRSPLRRVIALSVPIDAPGATGQTEAAHRATLVADALGAERWTMPFGEVQHAAVSALAVAAGTDPRPWAAGQLLSVLRTPALYGTVALLAEQGHRAVVVGTTNRDEGAYLGFFGKASDGMVDVQPIADLHKAEVRTLARHLGVPDEVVDAEPRGDVWDGRTDRELIGAGYDEVEAVLRLLELGRDPEAVAVTLADGERLVAAARAVAAHHAANAHKYAAGSPAVHLDVLPRAVPGGATEPAFRTWRPASQGTPTAGGWGGERPPPPAALPGAWHPPPFTLAPAATLPGVERLDAARHADAVVAHDVLTRDECAALVGLLDGADPEPVGVTGVRDDGEVGSWRATAWSPDLAATLWPRLAPAVPALRVLDAWSATDGHATADRTGHRTWRAVGLSPVLRFMRYRPGGHHLAHHDAAYDYGDGRRTLVSVVWYLTDAVPGAGGGTRLVDDGQQHLPTRARDHRDWDRPVADHEVLVAVRPEAGAVLCFDHRACHDVAPWAGPGERVVVRGDVVYEAVPDGRALP